MTTGVGCLEDNYTGSLLVIDFLSELGPSAAVPTSNGSPSHYELWASFGDEGVISLARFSVGSDYGIFDYIDETVRLGTVFNQNINLQYSGFRVETPYYLGHADSLFMTLEENGETDVAPSAEVVLSGSLMPENYAVLRGDMVGEYENILGQIRYPTAQVAIVLLGEGD
jgi:hypothetical protein